MSPARLLATALVCAAIGACTAGAPTTTPSSSREVPSEGETSSAPSPTPTAPTAPPSTSPSPSATVDLPEPDAEVASADQLAERLVAAEEAIRDPSTAPEDLRPWAHVQHASYRTLHAHPEWRDEVAAAMPGAVRPAFEANLHAQDELFALTEPRTELPDWRIVPAPPADELLGHYRAAGEEFGIDWTYLAAIHLVESRMGRIRGDSTAGAQGPMQFLPSTWEAYGEGDIQDPRDAIRAAARYLAAHGAPADMAGAVWAYNHSDHYVEAIESYAGVMRTEPATFQAYYHWRVYYRLATGDVVLEEGWQK